MTRCCNLGHLTVSRYPPPRWFRFRRRVSNSWKRILENTFRRITMKVLTMQLNSTSVMDIVAYGGAAIGMAVAVSEFLNKFFISEDLSQEHYGVSSWIRSMTYPSMESSALLYNLWNEYSSIEATTTAMRRIEITIRRMIEDICNFWMTYSVSAFS